jgi:hypothetical protein
LNFKTLKTTMVPTKKTFSSPSIVIILQSTMTKIFSTNY